MLKKEEKTTITGKSVIDGVEVCGFTASISSADPTNYSLNRYQINKELYKENRETCRADETEFEDYVFELQDRMITESTEV